MILFYYDDNLSLKMKVIVIINWFKKKERKEERKEDCYGIMSDVERSVCVCVCVCIIDLDCIMSVLERKGREGKKEYSIR